MGNSIGTGPKGVTAPVVEVKSLDELEKLGREKGKARSCSSIGLWTPTDEHLRCLWWAVDQRALGASRASRLGAVAALVRFYDAKAWMIFHIRVDSSMKRRSAILGRD
ncbi:hypothetical protein D5R40_34420 [Okeania hirsuta]|uniref:Uncharacterized protein n=1 Tax=Okeania hirsuta TaxID=1458930 RepID=A0A3N6NW14_9CYAN|nr:hypothetical protein D5R40_34420 [Okeania hirsuta]